MSFPTDIEIAQNANMLHIRDIAKKIEINQEDLEYYGKYKAKIPLSYINEEKIKQSKLILVITSFVKSLSNSFRTFSCGKYFL